MMDYLNGGGSPELGWAMESSQPVKQPQLEKFDRLRKATSSTSESYSNDAQKFENRHGFNFLMNEKVSKSNMSLPIPSVDSQQQSNDLERFKKIFNGRKTFNPCRSPLANETRVVNTSTPQRNGTSSEFRSPAAHLNFSIMQSTPKLNQAVTSNSRSSIGVRLPFSPFASEKGIESLNAVKQSPDEVSIDDFGLNETDFEEQMILATQHIETTPVGNGKSASFAPNRNQEPPKMSLSSFLCNNPTKAAPKRTSPVVSTKSTVPIQKASELYNSKTNGSISNHMKSVTASQTQPKKFTFNRIKDSQNIPPKPAQSSSSKTAAISNQCNNTNITAKPIINPQMMMQPMQPDRDSPKVPGNAANESTDSLFRSRTQPEPSSVDLDFDDDDADFFEVDFESDDSFERALNAEPNIFDNEPAIPSTKPANLIVPPKPNLAVSSQQAKRPVNDQPSSIVRQKTPAAKQKPPGMRVRTPSQDSNVTSKPAATKPGWKRCSSYQEDSKSTNQMTQKELIEMKRQQALERKRLKLQANGAKSSFSKF